MRNAELSCSKLSIVVVANTKREVIMVLAYQFRKQITCVALVLRKLPAIYR